MSTRAPFVLGVVFSYLTISASLQANTDLYSTGPGVGGPDGMCDVWQALFNGWGLSPSADEDLDGCSNLIESIAGTNPRQAGDCHKVGSTVISGGAVIFTFHAEAGKKYRVLSDDSPGGTFATVVNQVTPVAGQSQFIPSIDNETQTISIAKVPDSRKFYRLEVSDADSDSDGVSDWVELRTGLNPALADSNGDGISDLDEIEAEVAVPDELSIVATESEALEDGPQSGMFTVKRTRSLIAATVQYSLSGTASLGPDYSASPGATLSFSSGERSKEIHVNPVADSDLEGSESVTATLTSASAGDYQPPMVGPEDKATVIIYNSTAAAGTGLLARYYDHSSGTELHAANFGDLANYTFTLGSPTTTGTILVTPTTGDLPTLLAAVSVGSQVKLSFNGGNLNATAYNHQIYLVTAKTAANFTCSITSSTALPATSSSNLYFSILPVHPPRIARVDATVDYEWMGGTPNGNGLTPSNSPDNWSSVWEGYLHPTTTGNYRLQLDADDKARVLVDLNNNGSFELPGEEVIEHGWDTAATGSPEDGVADDETVGTFKISNTFALTASSGAATRYKIRVEHVETTGEARCRLQWSINNGTFANIPQTNIYSHVAAMTANYNYTRTVSTAGAMQGTILVSLTGHGYSVNDPVDLSFSSGNLFTPTNGNFHGTYQVAVVNSANTFTVNIAAPTLPASGTGAGYVLNRPTTTNPVNAWYNVVWQNTTFSGAPARVGTNNNGTNDSNNGLYGTGSPDPSIIAVDTFSVKWSGQVQPQFTEEYTISVLADDGCTLKINGQVQDMKFLASSNNGGSGYYYDNTSGNTIVNFANSSLKLGSVSTGEVLRLDPSNGNLALGNNSTYTYDSGTGDLVVNYSNLTNVSANGFVVGETVEVDPTSGSVNLGQLPYPITAATSNTFTVNIGVAAFESGSGNINVSDNNDRLVSAVYAAGTGTYTYTSATGATVVNFSLLGFPAGIFQVGDSVLLDPSGGNLSGQVYAYKTISAVTATTFTVSYPTGSGDSSSTIAIVATDAAVPIPPNVVGAYVVNFGAGKFANASVGTMNFNFANKSFKDWSSNGNERYVRVPMIGGTRYDIELSYWESSGFSRCRLYWFSPSQPKQIIPADRLYPSSEPKAPAAQTSDTNEIALVGGNFSYVLTGSNNGNISVSGLPAWLSYNSGVLSGTPPPGAAGDYQVLVTLTNPDGTSTSVVNLHVDETSGGITRDYWNGVTGSGVASIPAGTVPSGTSTVSSMEAPTDFSDNYGTRLRGYITAPETGNYYFWLASNGPSELWISNDDEPVNIFKRAHVVAGSATPHSWTVEAGQRSPWMALEQGHRYYIEVLYKAGIGSGDNVSVGWSKPGGSSLAPEEVVPGYALDVFTPPPPASPGTLYVATMLSQNGATTNGVGTATFRLSDDESYAIVTYSYSGLSGTLTDWHVHNDAFLSYQSDIMYDPNAPPPGSGPLPDNNPPTFTSHKWVFPATVGPMTKAQVIELIKQGKAYVNLHTALYPAGEIRGNLTLAAGSRTFSPPPAPPAWTDDHTDKNAASRFLTQATFGPRISDITTLQGAASYEAWIDDQFAKPVNTHLPEVIRTENASTQGGAYDENLTFNTWWWRSVTADDQLRQRIAFALSETLVVSAQGPLDNNALSLSYFYDVLIQDAFGNFRDILEDVTLTPTMGRYLDMLRNDKPDQGVGRIPNENYAREIKQLFSVGLFRMWPDGTLMLTSKDSPIDTYSQREIIGFAHVFTGWDYGYDGQLHASFSSPANWTRQMRETPARHYTGPKRLLNNEVLPGLSNVNGQPLDPIATHISTQYNDAAYMALPSQELDLSHDQLFNHPNVGPFVCRQLIQRLVTSNPSRDYVYRVVEKFNDNGAGVRGDMKAVIKAILLDYEARSPQLVGIPAYGKQREPVMRVASVARALRLDSWGGTYSQNGSRTITVTTSTPHGLTTGNVFLDFTSVDPAAGDPGPPWAGSYGISGVTTNSFNITAQGWSSVVNYSIPAGSTTCTVTYANHWVAAGNQIYVDFLTVSGGGMPADGIFTVAGPGTATDSPTQSAGTTFTITVPSEAGLRTGTLVFPRFPPGSYSVTASGLSTPGQERRVIMDTSVYHELKVGDQVQINFYNAANINNLPADYVATVDTVVDPNTWTFLAPSSSFSAIHAYDSVYQFPLKALPMTRTGTVGSRPSTFLVNNTDADLSQSPLNSPTVFNYYLPDYKFPGALASQGITTPEFQLTAETNVVRQANFLYNGVFGSSATNGVSSFNNGNNSLTLTMTPWMASATTAADLGLGAPSSTSAPWTHNQNLSALIENFNTLLMAGQLSGPAKTVIKNFIATPITSISAASPCVVTTSVPHNFNTGETVLLTGVTNGTFSATLNNTTTTRTVTKLSATTFQLVGVNCTSAPNASGLANAHVSIIPYNQGGTPTTTMMRDRLRAILHLIITSPDFTIQR